MASGLPPRAPHEAQETTLQADSDSVTGPGEARSDVAPNPAPHQAADLRPPTPTSSAEGHLAAVGLTVGSIEGMGHTGIFFVRVGGRPAILHLAFHLSLRCEPVPAESLKPTSWVVPAFPPERLQVLADLCESTAKQHQNGSVAYGFSFKKTAVSLSGKVVLGKGEAGLSCATFVMAVLKRAGMQTLDVNTWRDLTPERQATDNAAQSELADLLRRHADGFMAKLPRGKRTRQQVEEATRLHALAEQYRQHASHLDDEVGLPRFRAEEVAASTGIHPRPVPFDVAAPAGAAALAFARSHARPA